MIRASIRDGAARVLSAPAVFLGVLLATLLVALPLTALLRDELTSHLGSSLAAEAAADGLNYGWWQEFRAGSAELGSTFSPVIIGFAAVLRNIGSVADAQGEQPVILWALAAYVAVWLYLLGGIIDRYARQRPTGVHAFHAACGLWFTRLLRLGVLALVVYAWLFQYVHAWLFDDWYRYATQDLPSERTAFQWRLLMYGIFAVLLAAVNVLFDYAEIRAVVEDRRSMLGALGAAVRFLVRHWRTVAGLYLLNLLFFLALIGIWAFAAPGVGGTGWPMWTRLAAGQAFIGARLFLRLLFIASQTALFQRSLAHAGYVAAPAPTWPPSPSVEALARAGASQEP